MGVAVMEYRTIEIDIDVHKLIESKRRDFSEKQNDILRRVLKLPQRTYSHVSNPTLTTRNSGWEKKGVFLPSGTDWCFQYNDKDFCGKIDGGKWVYENQRYSQPSAVVSSLAVTKKGKKTRLDGWRYIKVRRLGDEIWRTLDELRLLLGRK